MNRLLEVLFMTALVFLMSLGSGQIYAQRCAGWVRYIVRDENGRITDPETAGLKFVRIGSHEYGIKASVAGIESESVARIDLIKTVGFETYCGLRLVEVMLQIERREMLLRFHNLPADTNFYVDSLPFQEGTFEIDFKRDIRLEGQELNREGLRDKDGNLLFRGTARAGYLVSANNWKRTTNQH